MSNDSNLAFGHPQERAEAMTPVDPPDRISLRDHIAFADIGAFQVERGAEQRLRFNVVVELLPQTVAGDDVDQILSYDRIAEAIAAELAAERLNLLETLADRICARLLAEPQPARVFLRVEKLDRGPGALGVEVVRSRRDVAATAVADQAPRPILGFVPADVSAASLGAWLNQVGPEPRILTVALPDTPRPSATAPEASRRIDLLALEQAAWAVAALDPRLSVVATRTELDWALRQGNPTVWAPGKMALDTLGVPGGADALALALWLAETLAAVRIDIHETVACPAGCRVPVGRF
ncbi:MAG: dihydroneopterin aldolase [Albidovulum sp.]